MGRRTPVYICLLCIVLARLTAAQAQGRGSSQNSVELGDRRVSVDTADDSSGVTTSSRAVGQNSASASATSISRSDGDKTSTFGAGSAEADGESVELAVTSETPVQAPPSQNTATLPSEPSDGEASSADTPAEAPAPEESSAEAPVATSVDTKTQENATQSNPGPKDKATVGTVVETSEKSEREEESDKAEAPAPTHVPEPESSSEDPEDKVLIVGSSTSQEKKAPKCWGEAAHRCCNTRDIVTNRYGTFCGCPESYKRWGIGYCRFKMASKSPRTWQYVNRFSSRYGTSCQCDDEMAPVKEVAPVCTGIVKHQCCDYYDGASDKCRCIFVGTKHERCFWKKVQNNPLTWEDDLILRGRKCSCPGR